MKRAWTKERRWECSKAERQFEKLLHDHGYIIEGYREYNSKTDFLISKDGITITWCIHHEKGVNAVNVFNSFIRYYDLTIEYNKLTRHIEGGEKK